MDVKKLYEPAEIEVIRFDDADIITTSDEVSGAVRTPEL